MQHKNTLQHFEGAGGSKCPIHRRRSRWNSKGCKASAEGRSAPSGVEYGEGYPHQPTRGSKRDRKRILTYFEGHRMLLFVPIWQDLERGTICISVPNSKFSLCSPVLPRSTPMPPCPCQRAPMTMTALDCSLLRAIEMHYTHLGTG